MRQKLLCLLVLLTLSLSIFSPIYVKPSAVAEKVRGWAQTIDPETDDSWSMFGHDLCNTRFSPSSAPHTPNLIWEFKPFPDAPSDSDRNIVDSSPAVVNGRVFIGARGSLSGYDKRVYCLNETDGTCIWSYETNGMIFSSPTVSGDVVYIGSYGGVVYCLNATTGALIWNYTVGEIDLDHVYYSSPTVVDNRLFVGTSGFGFSKCYLYCLNATNGDYIWRYEVFEDVYSSPAVVAGRVFVGGSGPSAGRVYCLNERTGENIWTYITGDHVGASSPAVVNGRVFIGSFDHHVYCLDETDGEQIWSYAASSWIDSSPAVADGMVFIASEDANIYCLNETTGDHIWTHKAIAQIDFDLVSSPTVANGMVFIGQGGPGLITLDEPTGELAWNYHVGSESWSSPAVADGKVFVGFAEGVYCIGSAYPLTINPAFNDNVGSTLDTPPSSWSVLLPNGTVRTVFTSSVTFPQAQPGNYSIVSIVWKGSEVSPEMPPSVFVASNIMWFMWSPTINCRLPTHLTLALSASTSYLGFKVNIGGRLVDYENASISGAAVLMEYSVTGGEPWIVITADHTRADGHYSAVWMPSATGNYLIRATWSGNATYPGTSTNVSFAVTPSGGQDIFSVASNSTVSGLAFNSTSSVLSFTVSGPPGTTGYVEVTIAKGLVSDITKLKVYLDGNQLDYTVASTDDSWLLYFTYLHSTHSITMSLAPAVEVGVTYLIYYLVAGVVGVALFLAFVTIRRRRA